MCYNPFLDGIACNDPSVKFIDIIPFIQRLSDHDNKHLLCDLLTDKTIFEVQFLDAFRIGI